jgi:hypothetical protein
MDFLFKQKYELKLKRFIDFFYVKYFYSRPKYKNLKDKCRVRRLPCQFILKFSQLYLQYLYIS